MVRDGWRGLLVVVDNGRSDGENDPASLAVEGQGQGCVEGSSGAEESEVATGNCRRACAPLLAVEVSRHEADVSELHEEDGDEHSNVGLQGADEVDGVEDKEASEVPGHVGGTRGLLVIELAPRGHEEEDHDTKAKVEGAVGGEEGGAEHLVALVLEHASDELGDTAIEDGNSDPDQVRSPACVVEGEDEGGEGEGAEAHGTSVRQFAAAFHDAKEACGVPSLLHCGREQEQEQDREAGWEEGLLRVRATRGESMLERGARKASE